MTRHPDWEHCSIAPGVDLYVHPTPRFKSTLLKMYVHRPLGADATAVALLPMLLRRGCRGATNLRKMSEFLEGLYGASLGTDVIKLGERQVMTMRLDVVNDRFAPHRIRTLEKGIRFLSDLLLRPVLRKGVFPSDVLHQEMENHRRFLQGRTDDRMTYAFDRCIEEMCRTEPYGLSEYGRLEDLSRIRAASLTALHEEIVHTAPIHIFVVGDVRPRNVEALIRRHFRFGRRQVASIPAHSDAPSPTAPREIVEKLEVEQGRLVIGFRTGIRLPDPDIFASIYLHAVLGAFPHSKLFLQVRERLGLAYSVSTSLESTKGLMFLSGGIDPSKFREVLAAIRTEVDEVCSGNVTDQEFDLSRKSLIDRVHSQRDNPSAQVAIFEEMLVNQMYLTPEESIAGFEAVTKPQICSAAKRLIWDTIFFLTADSHGR